MKVNKIIFFLLLASNCVFADYGEKFNGVAKQLPGTAECAAYAMAYAEEYFKTPAAPDYLTAVQGNILNIKKLFTSGLSEAAGINDVNFAVSARGGVLASVFKTTLFIVDGESLPWMENGIISEGDDYEVWQTTKQKLKTQLQAAHKPCGVLLLLPGHWVFVQLAFDSALSMLVVDSANTNRLSWNSNPEILKALYDALK